MKIATVQTPPPALALPRTRFADYLELTVSQARDQFRALLARRPALVTVRRSRGRDVQGACGQLVHQSA